MYTMLYTVVCGVTVWRTCCVLADAHTDTHTHTHVNGAAAGDVKCDTELQIERVVYDISALRVNWRIESTM